MQIKKFKVGTDRDLEHPNTTQLLILDRKVELSATELKKAICQIDNIQFSMGTKLLIIGKIRKLLYFQQGVTLEGDWKVEMDPLQEVEDKLQ